MKYSLTLLFYLLFAHQNDAAAQLASAKLINSMQELVSQSDKRAHQEQKTINPQDSVAIINNILINEFQKIQENSFDLGQGIKALENFNSARKSTFISAYLFYLKERKGYLSSQNLMDEINLSEAYSLFAKYNDSLGQFYTYELQLSKNLREIKYLFLGEEYTRNSSLSQNELNLIDKKIEQLIVKKKSNIASIFSNLKERAHLNNRTFIRYSVDLFNIQHQLNAEDSALIYKNDGLLERLLTCEKTAIKHHLKNELTTIYNSLGNYYYRESDMARCISFHKRALYHSSKNSHTQLILTINIGNDYRFIENYDSVLHYAQKAEEIILKNNISISTSNMNAIVLNTHNLTFANEHFGNDTKRQHYVNDLRLVKRIISSSIINKYNLSNLAENIATEKKINRTNYIIIILGLLLIFALSIIIYLFYKWNKRQNEDIKTIKDIKESREQLYTLIAHDIISPIRAYSNLSATLSHWIKQNDTEKIMQLSSQVEKDSLTLSENLNNFFAWASENNSMTDADSQLCSIGEIVNSCLEFHKGTILENRLKITNNNTLISCNTNKIFLTSIIRNALDNAIKNAPLDTAIEINYTKNKNTLELSISNEGSLNKKTLSELNKLHSHQVTYKNTALGQGSYFIYSFCKKIDGHVHYEAKNNKIIFHLSIPVE